jgi:ribosomal protein S18 acetylase RimI-like enzyme
MPAYRFCRTDDIPFLADALNECYRVHFPVQEAFSAEDFKREIRELNVWASSCMAVTEDGKPIGVVTGAKREHETFIHRIGVHPDHLRRGHARHLLESLSHKLSVLGPPRVVAEVPDDRPEVGALFEAVGYKAEGSFADFSLPTALAPVPATCEVGQVGLEELVRHEALDPRVCRSWQRALETLRNRKEQIRGLAIASDTRVEACVLFRDLTRRARREIVALGGAAAPGDGTGDARTLLEIVIRAACQAGSLAVTVPRVSESEIRWAGLERMGFRRERTYTLYSECPGSVLH